jgi:outer membrane protein assembly factor BamB
VGVSLKYIELKVMKLRIIVYLILLPFLVYSQAELQWSREYNTHSTYAPPYSNDRSSPQMKEDLEGNVIVYTKSNDEFSSSNSTLLKYSPEGQLLWEFTFNTEDELFDSFNSIVIDNENNIIIAGYITTVFYIGYILDYESKLIILKVSPEGELIWSFIKEGNPLTSNTANSIMLLEDTIYAVGTVNQNFNYNTHSAIVMGIDSSDGSLIWESTLEDLEGGRVFEFEDHLRIFAARDIYDLVTLDYETGGNLIGSNLEMNIRIHPNRFPAIDSERNFYITQSFSLSKFDPEGSLQWEYQEPTNLPEALIDYDVIRDIAIGENEIIVTGGHYSEYLQVDSFYNFDALTLKLDLEGNLIWRNRFDHEGENTFESGLHANILEDGKVLVTGSLEGETTANRGGFTMILNQEGQRDWMVIRELAYQFKSSTIGTLVSDENFYTLSWESEFNDTVSFYLDKYTYDLSVDQENIILEENRVSVFPNPTGSIIYFDSFLEEVNEVNISMHNSQGSLVLNFQNYNKDYILIPKWIPNGTYFLQFKQKEKYSQSKIIIQRN